MIQLQRLALVCGLGSVSRCWLRGSLARGARLRHLAAYRALMIWDSGASSSRCGFWANVIAACYDDQADHQTCKRPSRFALTLIHADTSGVQRVEIVQTHDHSAGWRLRPENCRRGRQQPATFPSIETQGNGHITTFTAIARSEKRKAFKFMCIRRKRTTTKLRF
jgi:hypothetical protein